MMLEFTKAIAWVVDWQIFQNSDKIRGGPWDEDTVRDMGPSPRYKLKCEFVRLSAFYLFNRVMDDPFSPDYYKEGGW